LETRPQRIFHLAFPEAWDAVQPSGEYYPAHYASDGFIHCSTEAQLKETAAIHFPNATELRIIILPTLELGPELKWETSRNGEDFPHLYRGIRVPADVSKVFTVSRDHAGNWKGWEL